MKEIVFLFDGTSMSLKRKSNISKLYCLFKYGELYVENEEDFETKNPNVVYQVGPAADGDKVAGTLYGLGFIRNIKKSYRDICRILRNFEGSYKLAIFGFSRGAYTARVFAHLISDCGVPINIDFCDSLVDNYLKEKREILNVKRRDIEKIDILGLFDTVRTTAVVQKDDEILAPKVENCYHAMSLDEERVAFDLLKFKDSINESRIDAQWFAGVHSDIGGSFDTATEGLSNITLNWIVEKCKALNFTLPIVSINKDPYAILTKNKFLPDINPREYEGEKIHSTVIERIEKLGYVPKAKGFIV